MVVSAPQPTCSKGCWDLCVLTEPALSRSSKSSRGNITVSYECRFPHFLENCHENQLSQISMTLLILFNNVDLNLVSLCFHLCLQPRLRSMRKCPCRVSSSWCIAPIRLLPSGSFSVIISSASLCLSCQRYMCAQTLLL